MKLADYEIDVRNTIGQGEFGTVYRAFSRQRGRNVAIKQIPLAKIELERSGADTQRSFSRLHPGLVPEVYDDGIDGDYYYIVMELIDAPQLEGLVSSSGLDYVYAARIALAIASFLEKAHALNLCHSDLKPSHIFVMDDGTIRVIDFGITRQLSAGATSRTSEFASQPYASPELLLTSRVNHGSDRWALGIILFEMVSRHHPYSHVASTDLLSAISKGWPMADLPADCPPVLGEIVRTLLAFRPEDRYRDSSAVVAALRAFANGSRGGQRRSAQYAATLKRPHLSARLARRFDSLSYMSLIKLGGAVCVLLLAASILLAESIGWASAGQVRDQVNTLAIEDVQDLRTTLRQMHRWTPFGLGLKFRVAPSLTARLAEIADRFIVEYRNSAAGISEMDWRQAENVIALAADVSPNDALVISRQRLIQGHLARLDAGTATQVEEAISLFRQAAQLNPASPDPYLGLARIHTEKQKNIESLVDDIVNAEKRGFQRGPRERAALADGYRVRADEHLTVANELEGAVRRSKLQFAVTDYQACIQNYLNVQIGRSAEHLQDCRTRAAGLAHELRSSNP